MGALFVSSTSVFVSCKDYDEDINVVSNRVTALEAAKVDLENKISTLRADLEANYATKAALADTAYKERARALAAEAALSTRIQTAQDALDDLEALIGGDFSDNENFKGLTYKEAVVKTWSKIESVEKGLGDRLTALETDLNLDDASSKLRLYLKNIENQIAALEAWQKGLNDDGGAATKNYVGTEIAAAEARAAIDAATKAATAETNAKSYTDIQLAEKIAQALKDAAADAQKKADQALADAKTYTNAEVQKAKEYAAAEAKAKADAAQKAAEEYAKDYADAVEKRAATDASTKAKAAQDAAEAYAKKYADNVFELAKQYTAQYADSIGNDAKGYADTQIGVALKEAKAYAEQMRDEAKAYTDTQIQNLKDNELQDLSDRIDDLQGELNVLDMFIQQLRSLVFIPEGYIDGVEALEVFSMNYRRYNNFATAMWIPNVDWNVKEQTTAFDAYNESAFDKTATGKKRDADHPSRYNFQDGLYRVLDFTAKYHMNPSNAQLDDVKQLEPVVVNKWFDVTRTGDLGMVADGLVKPGEGENPAKSGQLWAKYKMTNPNNITAGDQITVFATKVTYGDTVITSDYATFRNKFIDSLVLAHAPKELAPSYRGIKNTHCGAETVVETGDLLDHSDNLLFATITEAAGIGADVKDETTGFAAQDSVWYTSAGLELETLVETHYRDVNAGKHKWLKDISKYGLHYGFELTYLVYGSNLTSESAHAVINEKDGKHYLIPWLPTNESREGKQSPYDPATYDTDKAKYQTRQLIGRTPLVRVTLQDESGNVLDYGYIRILITDTVATTPTPSALRRFIEYTGPAWSYEIPWTVKSGCSAFANNPYEYETKWIETELDLYALAGVSHAEFLAGWTPEYKAGTAGPLVQYAVSGKNATTKMAVFTALTDDLGEVVEKPNATDPTTNILSWEVKGASAATDNTLPGIDAANETYHEFIEPATRPTSRTIAIRYKSNDGNEAKDIYVILNTGTLSVTEAGVISGTINWGDRKNPNYWYATNSAVERSGLKEVHANVYGVEDDKEPTGQTTELQQTIAATFMNNEIVDLTSTTDKDAFITLTNGGTFTGKDVALRLEFVKGAINTFKGIYTATAATWASSMSTGKTYDFTMLPSVDGMKLQAFLDLDKDGKYDAGEPIEDVAQLVYTTTTTADQDINHMRVEYLKTDFAKALLNYRAHNDLQDDFLTAYVAVKGKIDGCEIELSGDPINIRFLRPVNVKSQSAEVEDASVNGKQVIYLRDIVALDDWRDEPFKSNYWFYYGVTDIEIVGVPAGGNLAINSDVKTNMSLDPDAEPTKPLGEVSELVELQYDPIHYTPVAGTAPAQGAYGTLTYTNLGSTVQKFTLRLPVKVTYIWGDVYTTVDVKVLCTKNNARRF